MQALWDWALDAWPYGDRLFYTVAFCFGHSVLTLPFNFVALFLYFFPSHFLNQWKIQPDSKPSLRLIKEVVPQVLLNHLVTSPLFAYFLLFPLAQALDMPMRGSLPSLGRILFEFLVFAVVNDVAFYWAHRLLHAYPWLYKNVHAQHHRFTATVSWAAEFAHPLESILANSIPTLAGCFIMRSHLFTCVLWMIIRMWETLDAHCGFTFPWSPWRLLSPVMLGSDGHDWHHSHNRGCYGVSRFWDWLFGTDKEYKKWLAGGDVPAESYELQSPKTNPAGSQQKTTKVD
jgi:sterol desaturase/sphingolipid hydroxylase (fatty acid hydroxylase superfamily)